MKATEILSNGGLEYQNILNGCDLLKMSSVAVELLQVPFVPVDKIIALQEKIVSLLFANEALQEMEKLQHVLRLAIQSIENLKALKFGLALSQLRAQKELLTEYVTPELVENTYYGVATETMAYHCIDCALETIFALDHVRLNALLSGDDDNWQAANGENCYTIHEDSIQSFPYDFYPQGLKCAACEGEIIEEREEY